MASRALAAIALLCLAQQSMADTLSNPFLPAPTDLRGAYNATTAMVDLTWNPPDLPDGIDPAGVTYSVYGNGIFQTSTAGASASVPASPGPMVFTVTTSSGGRESSPSQPLLVEAPMCEAVAIHTMSQKPFLAWGVRSECIALEAKTQRPDVAPNPDGG